MPLQPTDITGVQTAQTTSFDAQGRPAQVMRISFKVRGQGPFFCELPVTQFTADAADKLVQQAASQIVMLLDKYPQG